MFSFKKFFEKIKTPHVYALVGESGTGKSYRAQLLAQEYKIKLIIDDGLLIEGDRILAGKSAKLAQTILGSLRIALFDNTSLQKFYKKIKIKKYSFSELL